MLSYCASHLLNIKSVFTECRFFICPNTSTRTALRWKINVVFLNILAQLVIIDALCDRNNSSLLLVRASLAFSLLCGCKYLQERKEDRQLLRIKDENVLLSVQRQSRVHLL